MAFIPRPVYALIFICPPDAYHKTRESDDGSMPEYDGSGDMEPVIWFKQTIGNACGLIGLLHAVTNGAREYIQSGSDLEKILQDAIPLKPLARAEVLYNSQALESAHSSAAQMGDTTAPAPEEKSLQHFLTFVKGKDGHLWEMDGGWKGPLDRGELGIDDDALSEKALQVGVRRFMAQTAGKLQFSIVALAPGLD